MVVSIGGAPASPGDGAPDPARPGAPGRTRRDLARGLRVCALAAALAPVVAAFPSRRPGPGPVTVPDGTDFDETYRGRRIRGVWIPARGAAEDGRWQVTVDGRPLHVMRRADGTWLSMVDHYRPCRTPLDAARAAVDELGPGRRLRGPARQGEGHPHTGDRHGVRA